VSLSSHNAAARLLSTDRRGPVRASGGTEPGRGLYRTPTGRHRVGIFWKLLQYSRPRGPIRPKRSVCSNPTPSAMYRLPFAWGGHVMIHVLRGRRTWLDTSPALREAGRVPQFSIPGLFPCSQGREVASGRAASVEGGYAMIHILRGHSSLLHLNLWPRSRPGIVFKGQTSRPLSLLSETQGCPRTDAGSTRSRRDK
jgi:hypothetical protein